MAHLHVDQRGLRKLERQMEQLPPKVLRALGEGLKEGGDKTRTEVRRVMKTYTGARTYGAITKRIPSFAPSSSLTYTIRGVGIPMGIPEEVPANARGSRMAWMRWSRREHWRLQGRDGGGRFGKIREVAAGVIGFPWAIAHHFQRSFRGPNGMRQALLEEGRVRLRRLFGPNVADELVKGPPYAAFLRGLDTHVVPAIMRRLGRLGLW